ncbi:hypothetical protein CHU98_g5415 [Xylaria longipes]|nr:hypothetical protein CHU98_g5415 [Xylaria longipes]
MRAQVMCRGSRVLDPFSPRPCGDGVAGLETLARIPPSHTRLGSTGASTGPDRGYPGSERVDLRLSFLASMAVNTEAKVIFTILTLFPFLYFKENQQHLVSDDKTIFVDAEGRQLDHANAAHDEDSTPEPEPVQEGPFLRITTDDAPKRGSDGFAVCDILLDTGLEYAVSRMQFALRVTQQSDGRIQAYTPITHPKYSGDPTVSHDILNNSSPALQPKVNPLVSYQQALQQYIVIISWVPRENFSRGRCIKDQKAISQNQRELTMYVGNMNFRVEFPDHSDHYDLYQQYLSKWFIKNNCQVLPSRASLPPPDQPRFGTWKDVYGDIEFVGCGEFGAVYRASDRTTGKVCAVKECYRGRSKRDLPALLQMKHGNVIRYFAFYPDAFAVLMESSRADLATAHGLIPLSPLELRDVSQ